MLGPTCSLSQPVTAAARHVGHELQTFGASDPATEPQRGAKRQALAAQQLDSLVILGVAARRGGEALAPQLKAGLLSLRGQLCQLGAEPCVVDPVAVSLELIAAIM